MSVKLRGKVYHYCFRLNGKRYRNTTGQIEKRKAEAFERLEMARIESLGDVNKLGRMPLREFVDLVFLPWLREAKEGKTRADYEYGWKLLKDTRVAHVRVMDLSKSDAEMLKFKQSNYAANSALRTLRRILGLAVDHQAIKAAPAIPLRPVEGRKGTYDELTTDRIIAASPQPLRDVFILTRFGGMRNGREVIQMRWEHMDWERKTYFVYGSKSTKGKRIIPLDALGGGRAFDVLKARHQGEKEGWIFPNGGTQSGHIRVEQVDKQFREVRTQLGLPEHFVIYMGRHSAGTDAMQKTQNQFAVRDFLGHVSVNTTNTYVQPEYVKLLRQERVM